MLKKSGQARIRFHNEQHFRGTARIESLPYGDIVSLSRDSVSFYALDEQGTQKMRKDFDRLSFEIVKPKFNNEDAKRNLILDFVKKWGLLFFVPETLSSAHDEYTEIVADWESALSDYRFCSGLALSVVNAAHGHGKAQCDALIYLREELKPSTLPDNKEWRQLSDTDRIGFAAIYLSNILTHCMGMRFSAIPNEDGTAHLLSLGLRWGVASPSGWDSGKQRVINLKGDDAATFFFTTQQANLLSKAFYGLAQSLTECDRVKQCSDCGRIIMNARANQMRCAKCRNRMSSKNNYAKNKEILRLERVSRAMEQAA